MINIIKSGVGNIGSLVRVIEDLEINYKIINKSEDFKNNWKIIIPGIGSFDSFITSLKKQKIFEKLIKLVVHEEIPILGICVGMQSFFNNSEEGKLGGLGFINSNCKKFANNNKKIPHIGWNKIKIIKKNKLFNNIENHYYYYAHSYHVTSNNDDIILGTTNYGYDFIASINYKNIYGVQFHPEKSYTQGKQLIKNFISEC